MEEEKEEIPKEVQKLTSEDVLAKEIQLDTAERHLEQMQLELKQVEKRDKSGFFEKQGEFLKQETYKKIRGEIERLEHNIEALKIQIKTGEVSI